MAEPEVDLENAATAPCSPCRGTGTLKSNLGGESHDVPCPWCEGSGVRPARGAAQSSSEQDGG